MRGIRWAANTRTRLNAMTAEQELIARLRAELMGAFAARARLYQTLLVTLEDEVGPDRARAILARTLERRGHETAVPLFAGVPPEPQAVARAFLAVSPDAGRLFPHEVESGDDVVTIRVHKCPLQEAWRADGHDDARIATLCTLAGAFDKGLFEAAGIVFSNQTWMPGQSGCCRIRLARRREPA